MAGGVESAGGSIHPLSPMGSKFRVKTGLQAPSVLRRNGRRINQPPHFHDSEEAFQSVQNSFYLADWL
jgi:hypothetical protein